MSELRFDIRGNLTPYELVEIPIEVFRETFVESFGADSTRHGLWTNFERYLSDFWEQIGELPFQIWVNGSFARVRHNPKDIDIVIFLNFEVAIRNEKTLREQFVSQVSEERYGVDAYLLRVFPENHADYFKTVSDMAYWREWFGMTRRNRSKKRFPKGFIQLTFQP